MRNRIHISAKSTAFSMAEPGVEEARRHCFPRNYEEPGT